MRKLIIILSMMVIVTITYAQQGVPKAITVDTVTNANTEYLYTETFSRAWNTLSIQLLCTQLSGTSAGTAVLQASVDGTSWQTITDATGMVKGFVNDTLTVANGAVGLWMVTNTGFYKYRIKITGSGTHSTLITSHYIFK